MPLDHFNILINSTLQSKEKITLIFVTVLQPLRICTYKKNIYKRYILQRNFARVIHKILVSFTKVVRK